MIPSKISPDNLVMNKSVEWCKHDNRAKRELLPRVVYAVGGSALALVSLVFNLAVFLIKLPVTTVRLVFGAIRTKNGKFADRFPKDTTIKALLWHAYKVVICLVDVILTPTLGLVHPRAHNWVHLKMHILIPTNKSIQKQLPQPQNPPKPDEVIPAVNDQNDIPPPPPPPVPPRRNLAPTVQNIENEKVEEEQVIVRPALDPIAFQGVKLKKAEDRPQSPKTESNKGPQQLLAETIDKNTNSWSINSDSSDSDGEGDDDWSTFTPKQREQFLTLRQQREEKERLKESQKNEAPDTEAKSEEKPLRKDAEKTNTRPLVQQVGEDDTIIKGILARRSAFQDTVILSKEDAAKLVETSPLPQIPEKGAKVQPRSRGRNNRAGGRQRLQDLFKEVKEGAEKTDK